MKELSPRAHIIAGILVSTLAGVIVYAPWVVLESLLDFMEPPRQVANVGLLIVVFSPVVLLLAAAWRKIAKPKPYFFESLTVSALFTFLIIAAVHQTSVTERWRETPEGRAHIATLKGAAAWDRVSLRSRIADLKPPLNSLETSALATRVHDPDVDGATLHHLLMTFPGLVDCDIIQNTNVLQKDLLTIWNKHNCREEYFIRNPQTPPEVVKEIFDSHHDAEPDQDGRKARNLAAARLAKESCDPKLLYALFNAKSDLARNTDAGLQMRIQMVPNICTPLVVRAQMEKLPDLKQPADYERLYGYLARGNQQAGEAQYWVPSRQ